jgi:hypothetical protein
MIPDVRSIIPQLSLAEAVIYHLWLRGKTPEQISGRFSAYTVDDVTNVLAKVAAIEAAAGAVQ